MSTRPIRVSIFGLGAAGRQVVRSLAERGADIVGVFDLRGIGDDAGGTAGIGPIGVPVSDAREAQPADVRADVAVITVGSSYDAISPLATSNLAAGTNVITIAEDAFFPWDNADLAASSKLNEVAAANGVSFLATGMQDIIWEGTAVLYSALVNDIATIRLTSRALQDGTSQEILDSIYVNQTVEQFEAAPPVAHKELLRGPLLAIARRLGLTVTAANTTIEPIVTGTEHYSAACDLTIQAGHILGTREITRVQTEEGLALEAEFLAKLAQDGDTDGSSATFESRTNLAVQLNGISGFESTAASIVSRIPDVVTAPPGVVFTGDLPMPAYRPTLTIYDAEDH